MIETITYTQERRSKTSCCSWTVDTEGRCRHCCHEGGHRGCHESVGYPYHMSWSFEDLRFCIRKTTTVAGLTYCDYALRLEDLNGPERRGNIQSKLQPSLPNFQEKYEK